MTPGPALLPEDRRGGEALAGILALLVFLALLIAAFGLGIAGAARLVDRQAGRLTVQVAAAEADRALAVLRAAPGVARAVPVDRATLLRLLRPWLGDDPAAAGLPIPAMIDVELHDPAVAGMVAARVRRAVPVIRVDRADHWLAPLIAPIRLLMLVAGLLVALLVAAIGGTARLATRRTLAHRHAAITVIHALGATDRQLAAPVRRWAARAVLAGTAIGGMAALIVAAALSIATASPGSAVLRAVTLRAGDWASLAALAVALAALAIVVAARTTTRTLARLP